MEKQLDLTDEKIAVIENVGEALADFLSVAMRDLAPAAVAAMNRKLASGTGFYRLTTETSATGMRVFAAFVVDQNVVPILDIHIGDSENESRDDGGHPSGSLH